jgi:putative tryptophan/tyrosine transport system substrate-binding protein
MSGLSRRQFVVGGAGLGLLAGCGRLPWQAEQPRKVARIGLLYASPVRSAAVEPFREGLRELGYVEGQTFVTEERSTLGQPERLPDLAAELVQLPSDIIVAGTAPLALATRDATNSTPIVMVNVGDPVGIGLVASLARPGGNVTGLSSIAPQLVGKRLELLKAAIPSVSRVAVLSNPGNPTNALQLAEAEAAAQALELQVQSLPVRGPADLVSAFDLAIEGRADALFPLQDPFLNQFRAEILNFASRTRLPTIHGDRPWVTDGVLMLYGTSITSQWHRAAYYVDRILRGTKPADLPVEQPMTFEFVVNLKTAQALGITFPNEVMLQVTEVIQ